MLVKKEIADGEYTENATETTNPTPSTNTNPPPANDTNPNPPISTLVVTKEKPYNFVDCRRALAEFVICDGMPFKVVEGRGFRRLVNRLEPRFTIPSRFTIAKDCYQLFLDEKKKLRALLARSCNRVCLTSYCWTSNQNLSYMCLTAHFIDEEWILQKRILNFCLVENHEGDTIGREIERCLREWGIEKVFAITVENASSNDVAISYLQKKLDARGGLVCGGKYLHMRCCAHMLNLIVNDGLKEHQPSIDSIRNAVRYVRSSPLRLKRFKECVEAELIKSESLVFLDVPTRWNSCYLMLEHAEKFEKAFDRLSEEESEYRRWFGEVDGGKKKAGPPTARDWSHARIFISFLKIFYDVTSRFLGSLHVTSNKCYLEISAIQDTLKSWSASHSHLLGSMASSMKTKFDKYWGNVEKTNPLLFVASILDPRYKLDFVTWSIEDTCDEELALKMVFLVKSTLNDLYKFYAQGIYENRGNVGGANDSSNSATLGGNLEGSIANDVVQSREEAWRKHKRAKIISKKTELEIYLEEKTLDEEVPDFDILTWWKMNSSKYRVLSVLARDVLAIPVSTVASESCFRTSGCVIDVFRSSLSPKMAEALICTQNWLNPAGFKFDDKDFDQFDITEKVVVEAVAKPHIHETQEAKDDKPMNVD